MTRNPVSMALEQVDTEPTDEFLGALRGQLLVDLESHVEPGAAPPASTDDFLELATDTSHVGPRRRVLKVLLAAAACIAVFATAALIANRPTNTADSFDPKQAAQLGQQALITAEALGALWRERPPLTDAVVAEQAAVTFAELPQCAVLTSVGLLPPTTKSVAARQSFAGRLRFMDQTVFVFATPEDASRAMDVIDGDIYPSCWFDLFDRLIPLESPITRSSSTAWTAPEITRTATGR